MSDADTLWTLICIGLFVVALDLVFDFVPASWDKERGKRQ